MNTKNIKTLISLMEKSGLSVIEITEGDTKIRLEKNNSTPLINTTPAVALVSNETSQTPLPASVQQPVDFNNICEVKSPMVGVFYSSPSPESEPFVKIGDKVKKGDVLCIIEAMKLMNEIVSEVDGEVVDICVKNGQVVEFSQILFKIF
jgi:acetyl-CoA carboxylase biotin carboxyl carrier protein